MSGVTAGEKFAHHARAVALEIFGEPNKALSSPKELRFGKQGSVSVDLEKGTFYDHQENEGGGVLWAIGRQTGQTGSAAVDWMRSKGFDVEDDRPARPTAGQAPRLDPSGNWLPPAVPDHGRLTQTYDYREADGTLRYQVCRYDWSDPANPKGHSKTFLQRRPDPGKANGWAYKMSGIDWLPYRLPELIEDIASGYPIFLVEGEKKVDMLRAIGVPATCNHGGAGKFPESLTGYFRGARVIVLPDNDQAGRDHAALIGRRLDGVAASTQIIEIPGLPPKGGVDDWLPAGGDAEKLYELLESHGKPLEAAPFQSKFDAVEWAHFDDPGPTYAYLVKGVLTEGEISMLLGESQSGKSFLAIDIAMAVARGVEFFGHRVNHGGVIYQAGESATGVRRKRFPAYRIGHNVTEKRLPLTLLQAPLDLYSSDDPTEAFIDECLYWGRRMGAPLKLIIIDTFSKATSGANENDGKDMGLVLARCDLIRRKTGAHVMLVHHLNAGGTKARGHTSLFANVENVITVKRGEDRRDANGKEVREWKIAKQKDGEDGKAHDFVLRGVMIGKDADGDDVYSCVVDRPSKGDISTAPADDGISVQGLNGAMLRAIYTAVQTKGVLAPGELALATGAMAVSRKDLSAAMRGIAADGDDDFDVREGETPDEARARRNDARRKRIERAREFLFTKGIIGLTDEWVWLTGAKVRGFGVPPGLGAAEEEVRKKFGRGRKNGDSAGGQDQSNDRPLPDADLDLPFDAPTNPEDWS